jgi:phosphatidylinositol alpha 1,6-mannosyltransferase
LTDLLNIEARAISDHDSTSVARAHSVQRVALFTEAFLPKVDGVSRTALLTLHYLERTGRQLLVIAPAPAPSKVGNAPIVRIPSLWLPTYPETRAAPPWPLLLHRLRRFQPDLIHLFSPFSLGAMGMLAGAALGVPVIANYQTDVPAYTRSYRAGSLAGLARGMLRFIHNGCHLTLVPSRATLAELRGWGFRRLRLWGRGVDAARFHPARRNDVARQRLLAGRDPSRLLVLYVGRMAKEKHLDTLRPLAHDPTVALTMVGGGYHRPSVEAALNTDGGQAHFTGVLLGYELADAYASADVFVFPGPEETFGQVVLEAMASGLPVIVSARGGPASLVVEGKTGFICPVDDGAAFLQRVQELGTEAAQRARMGVAAREFAAAQPWTAIMAQLEGYYAEALRLRARWQGVRTH